MGSCISSPMCSVTPNNQFQYNINGKHIMNTKNVPSKKSKAGIKNTSRNVSISQKGHHVRYRETSLPIYKKTSFPERNPHPIPLYSPKEKKKEDEANAENVEDCSPRSFSFPILVSSPERDRL